MKISSLLCLILISSSSVAQEESKQQEAAIQQAVQVEETDGPILRLQDTIRGNKEQPQVLTIVPWQLPSHKRIDEATQWQPVVDTLSPIERSRFLRNLQIFQENIKTSSETTADEQR